ncbi:MAG: penicillin acylase family protein [Gemmatimonadetes bacterium]|nr:penicillin acylase family protein [Gemmatimonadota bacterium]
MRIGPLIGFSLVTGGLLWIGARGAAPLPALGPLLDPANGVLAMSRTTELPRTWSGQVPGLSAPATVTYDDRGVPHVKAATIEDAYRAVGFVVARDRLFQMELQFRASAGRLAELSPRALPLDTLARTIGLPWGAERRFAALPKDSPAMRALEAYADGVNAYVAQMPKAALPVEYRLLGRTPMRWEAKHAFYFLARMNQTLSFALPELNVLKAQLLVGREAAEALYAPVASIQEPIQPNGQKAPRFDLPPMPDPGAPDPGAMGETKVVAMALSAFGAMAEGDETRRQASNNWAISARRTRDGHAILAGDPHLDLSLPSIWYEVQLTVPGRLDTYGFTFAGTPGVVLGFNRDVAWSATNTGADVVDFYRETVDDAKHPTKYQVDGQWRPIETHAETYRGPRDVVLLEDTLRFTHRGPLRKLGAQWVSMRWTALDTTHAAASLSSFQAADTAKSVAMLMETTADYPGPAQNFVMADREGNIGIRSTGLYPIRPAEGSGLVVRDGSTSASDWTGYWAPKDYPQSVNPPQGYLASANQQPIDPKGGSRYLGADWPPPWRAIRINQRLRADSAWTPAAVARMQVDSASARADFLVPYFLDAAARLRAAGRETPQIARAAKLLAEWRRAYVPSDKRAILFEFSMERLNQLLWDELERPDSQAALRPRRPTGLALARLLQQPNSKWWDDRHTPALETRDDILARALALGLEDVQKAFGKDSSSDDWRWGHASPIRLNHLLAIPAFSVDSVQARSGPETIAPRSAGGTHSASERLIVELGPTVRAWTTYPGGQSGNPFSVLYRDRIWKWANGAVDSVIFGDVPAARVRSTLTLTAGAK